MEQLIVGKALVAAAGEERAAALLRHIKPGAVFVARLGWGSPTTLTLTLALALTPALTLALILAPTLTLTLALILALALALQAAAAVAKRGVAMRPIS